MTTYVRLGTITAALVASLAAAAGGAAATPRPPSSGSGRATHRAKPAMAAVARPGFIAATGRKPVVW